MSELIYVLTVIYFVFVIESVEGDQIVAFMKRFLHIDLSQFRSAYTSLRDRFFNSMNLQPVSPA